MDNMIKVVRWEVKEVGDERSIQLFDDEDYLIDEGNAYWDGDFYSERCELESLEGGPESTLNTWYCGGNKINTIPINKNIRL